MNGVIEYIVGNTGWLYARIYDNEVFFIDRWTLVHFWSGGVVFAVLLHLQVRSKWLLLAAVLIGYECLELLIPYLALHIFRPEILKDQVTDICTGMLGGVMVARMMRWNHRQAARGATLERIRDIEAAGFVAVAIAFIWVGSYGYRYNVPMLNVGDFNYYVFVLWTVALFLVIWLYRAVAQRWPKWYLALGITWGGYSVSLAAYEYLSYHLLRIHEISKPLATPLFLDTMHGTRAMHAFYLGAPLLALGFYFWLRQVFAGADWESAVEGRPTRGGWLRSPVGLPGSEATMPPVGVTD